RGDGRPGRWRPLRQTPGRYGLLLFLLIATYLLSAFTSSTWIGGAQLAVFVATGFLALRSSGLPQRRARLIGLVGLAGSAAALGLSIARPNDGAIAAASIWTGLLLLTTIVVIVRRILGFSTVTIQSIFAAVSSYLMIGLMFAAFYAADYQLHGRQFFADGRQGTSQTFQYFSFTTLTTLGYGDFTASDSGGRAIAVLEALTGQIFLATLVARLVAAFRAPSGREDDGERGQD
ncbi:MAG: potassium channel family protein, partial [Streptosporangiaceae bacterium]